MTASAVIGLGIALLLGGPLVGITLVNQGAANGWLETPATPVLVPEVTRPVCPIGGGSTCEYAGDQYTGGVAYIPSARAWVVETLRIDSVAPNDGTGITEIRSPSLQTSATTEAGCDLAYGEYYPGQGPDVYFLCATASGGILLLQFNWASQAIDKRIPLGGSWPFWCKAYNPAQNRLYCPVRDPNAAGGPYLADRLLSIDVTNGTILANSTMPSTEASDPPMLYDPSSTEIYLATFPEPGVDLVNPSTGAILAHASTPGVVSSLAFDPGRSKLYAAVSLTPDGPPIATDNCSIMTFQAGSLTKLASVSVVDSCGTSVSFLDPSRGTIFFELGSFLHIYNESTNSFQGSLGVGSLAAPGADTYVAAYAPDSETFAIGEGSGGGQLLMMNFTRGVQTHPPYSAVPLAGENLPWVVGIGGFLSGAAILMVVGVGRYRRRIARQDAAAFQALTKP
ncbi:MAG TPA: hypothetical protein VGX00_05125 [Thermoplasmata archaeon]|nr:hypothetical protein [Thermoplasmata archaeon]